MTFLEPMCFLDARQIPMVDQLPKTSGVKILVPGVAVRPGGSCSAGSRSRAGSSRGRVGPDRLGDRGVDLLGQAEQDGRASACDGLDEADHAFSSSQAHCRWWRKSNSYPQLGVCAARAYYEA